MSTRWIAFVTQANAQIFAEKSFRRLAELNNDLGREDVANEFAKQVNEFLHKQMNLGHFDLLLMVADPKMMGRLRGGMDKSLAHFTQWLAKDLGQANSHDLKKMITEASGTGEIDLHPIGIS